MYLAIQLQECQ